MNILLLVTALICNASASPRSEWAIYKEKYNKVYTSERENVRRLEQYLKTREMVEEHNRKYDRGETTYAMGINKFSDWFPEELQALTPVIPQRARAGGKLFQLPPRTTVPDSINWVEKGAVTSVKDQGPICGSGYAFSAAGALEGLMFIKNNTITDLSAQEILDCNTESSCHWGDAQDAFDYVKDHKGITSEESYPYDDIKKNCRADKGRKVATCDGYTEMDDEDKLIAAVGTEGPVAINFGVMKDFILYKEGIFDGNCRDHQNHFMLAVGYGTDETTKKPYWLLKNSWGQDWGEKGYARVLRNVNQCFIGIGGVYPTYNK